MTAAAHRPLAPAYFLGQQEGFGTVAGFEIWNLTADIPGHPAGSSVSREALTKAGYHVPAAPVVVAPKATPAELAAYFVK